MNRAVVIPAYATQWPAMDRWTPAYLRDRFGQARVKVTDDRESDPDNDMKCAEHTRESSMAEYVVRVLASGDSNNTYMVANNRNIESPELAPILDDVIY